MRGEEEPSTNNHVSEMSESFPNAPSAGTAANVDGSSTGTQSGSTAEEAASYLAERLPTLTEWVERWRSYYTGTVTVKNTLYWLLQFGSADNVRIAFRLLEGLDFISESRLTHLLLAARAKLEGTEADQILFCPVGKAYDSALHISYPFSKAMQLRESDLARRWITTDALPEVLRTYPKSPIAFLDDNCTSGTQFIRFLEELTTDSYTEREHVPSPLDAEAVARLQQTPIRFLVGVDLVNKADFLPRVLELGFQDFRLVSGLEVYRNALDYGGGLWQSPEEAAQARHLLASIAHDLYADKGWPSERVLDRLLGYGNLGRLIAFAHNVPKSLPPVFWKHGQHAGRYWIPLFPERTEWETYSATIQAREEFMDYFAALIDSGHFGRTRPVCTADLIESEPGEGGVVEPLQTEGQASFVTEWVGDRTPLQHKSFEPRFGTFSTAVSFGDPTERDIAKYNKEVDTYNASFPIYVDRMRRAVERISSAFSLTFRVRNSGSAPATEVLFRVELVEGLDFDTEIGLMPDRPRYPALPDRSRMMVNPGLFRNPVVTSLERISEKMEDRQAGAIRQRLVVDGPRRFVEARIGRVLQHTFIDVTLNYFFAAADLSELALRHELIFAEGSRPVQGSVSVSIRRGHNIHPHAWEVIKPPSGKTLDDS